MTRHLFKLQEEFVVAALVEEVGSVIFPDRGDEACWSLLSSSQDFFFFLVTQKNKTHMQPQHYPVLEIFLSLFRLEITGKS